MNASYLLQRLLLWLSWLRIHLQCGRPGFHPWVGKIPWRRERLPTPVFQPGEFHGHGVANSWTRLSDFCFTSLLITRYPGGATQSICHPGMFLQVNSWTMFATSFHNILYLLSQQFGTLFQVILSSQFV